MTHQTIERREAILWETAIPAPEMMSEQHVADKATQWTSGKPDSPIWEELFNSIAGRYGYLGEINALYSDQIHQMFDTVAMQRVESEAIVKSVLTAEEIAEIKAEKNYYDTVNDPFEGVL